MAKRLARGKTIHIQRRHLSIPKDLKSPEAQLAAQVKDSLAEQRKKIRQSSLMVRAVGYIENVLPDGTLTKALIVRLVDKEGNDVVEHTAAGPVAHEFALHPVTIGKTLALDPGTAAAVGAAARIIH